MEEEKKTRKIMVIGHADVGVASAISLLRLQGHEIEIVEDLKEVKKEFKDIVVPFKAPPLEDMALPAAQSYFIEEGGRTARRNRRKRERQIAKGKRFW